MSFNPEYFFPTLITNITQLNGGQFGVVKGTDVYPAVDVTDVTQSPTGTTKPYQVLQLANYILGNLGLYVYAPVLAATTANLTATYNNGISGVGATLTNAGTQAAFVLDGQTGVLNGRYLVKNQSSPVQNGIYTLTNIGSATTNWVLTRSADFNQPANIVNGGIVYVIYGSTLSNTYWQDSFTPTVVVGTTAINYVAWTFSGATQYVSSNIASGSAVSFINNTVNDLTSISLTTGTWLVWGNMGFNYSNPNAASLAEGWINTASKTTPDSSLIIQQAPGTGQTFAGAGFTVLQKLLIVTTPITVYMSGNTLFSAGTCTVAGGLYAITV